MNLMTDPWIPIIRKDGTKSVICPWELTTNYEKNPIVKLNICRWDFTAAITKFLIAYFQTIYTIKNLKEKEWHKLYLIPPSKNTLKNLSEQFVKEFNLVNSEVAFMQDFRLYEKTDITSTPIGNLLIEQPGSQTLEKNRDLFIHRNQISGMCLPCCAMALYTLQINAPSGGAGHRTSLRGGGPITTLLVSSSRDCTLFQNIWLNILNTETFENIQPFKPDKKNINKIFPWTMATYTSEEDQQISTRDVNHLQLHWEMSRRIRLLSPSTKERQCSVCGNFGIVITDYITKNYGARYSSEWRHTLTPYKEYKSEQFPIHMQMGGVGYHHWLGFLFNNPAAVIKYNHKYLLSYECNIWVFGYDMDNMKARGWYESRMPFYDFKDYNNIDEILSYIYAFVKITEQIRYYLNISLKSCQLLEEFNSNQIYSDTEEKFYLSIFYFCKSIRENNKDQIINISLEWLSYLQHSALRIYDECTGYESDYFSMRNIKTIIMQRKILARCLASRKISSLLPFFAEKSEEQNNEE